MLKNLLLFMEGDCVLCSHLVSHLRGYAVQRFETCTYPTVVDIFYVAVLCVLRFKSCLVLVVD
jgi:hypothetical protein